MLLVPALHAKAEIVEGAGEPLARAAEQLARGRDIRHAQCGATSTEGGFASFNLAHVLVRGAVEEELPSPQAKAALLERATALALEACSTFTVQHNQPEQAAEFSSRLLELLDDAAGDGEVSPAAVAAERALRDAYLEATGEEWEAGGEEGGE